MICLWTKTYVHEKTNIFTTFIWKTNHNHWRTNRNQCVEREKTIKSVKQNEATRTIISNSGGFEVIQHICCLVLLRFYKIWTMLFGVFGHTSSERMCFWSGLQRKRWFHLTLDQTYQTASSKPYITLLKNKKAICWNSRPP